MIAFPIIAISIFIAVLLALSLIKRDTVRRVPSVLWWLALFIAIIALIIIFTQQIRFENHRRLNNWKPVNATIEFSRVIGERAFRPEVVFRYQVKGRIYRDTTYFNRPSFGGRRNRLESAENIVKANQPGNLLKVYYNPTQPAQARLKTRLPWDFYGQLSFGVLLLIMAVTVVSIKPLRGNIQPNKNATSDNRQKANRK